ncbi:hybrid sensor histidine kinase/response regulator [Novipirellula rosea]|uniref:histidine kinase n=1 Tax=Novipirellula rosea TaxID=1031540 RepID=A0ABP8NL41_9BACT
MANNDTTLSEFPSQVFPDDHRQKPNAIDQLHRVTAILAHELRNPLSVLQAGIDLMDDDANDEHSLKKLFQTQVQQMTRLVEDLLDLSRSADGRVRVKRRPIDLLPRLNDAIKSVEQVVAQRNQRITINVTSEPLWLNGDPQRIVQIFTNLLSNASKYSEQGTEIVVSVARVENDTIEIRVCDHGIGIDAEDLAIVFDFFSQVKTSDSLAHSDGGLGIGLGLVRTLVQMHGGSAWATSEGIGKGSEFVVRLPSCEPQLSDQGRDQSVEPLVPARILIVDDQRSNVYMLNALLEKLGGHELRSASDGATALSVLAEFIPEIVLLDLGLPGMSGLELAKEIRQLEHCRHSLLVALTGYDDDQLRAEATAAGVDLYHLKPVSMDLLQQILRRRRIER